MRNKKTGTSHTEMYVVVILDKLLIRYYALRLDKLWEIFPLNPREFFQIYNKLPKDLKMVTSHNAFKKGR